MNETPLLVATELGKRVPGPDGELTLLHDIDLQVMRGESLAITGPSGSGKSTLLGLLAGLDLPSSGNVTLQGEPFSSLDEDQRAARRGAICSFVFQAFHLVRDLTAQENVMLPMELRGDRDAVKQSQLWLDKVGLGSRSKHFPDQLSGGEQQRVALARAFATNPKLLFADEPTGSLDHANGERIADLLFGLNRETGTTLILVTHDEHLAARCHRRVRLEEGCLHG